MIPRYYSYLDGELPSLVVPTAMLFELSTLGI
jgi:hypothetical protein